MITIEPATNSMSQQFDNLMVAIFLFRLLALVGGVEGDHSCGLGDWYSTQHFFYNA